MIDMYGFVSYFLNPANTSKLVRAIMSASIRLGHANGTDIYYYIQPLLIPNYRHAFERKDTKMER